MLALACCVYGNSIYNFCGDSDHDQDKGAGHFLQLRSVLQELFVLHDRRASQRCAASGHSLLILPEALSVLLARGVWRLEV